MKTRLTGGNRPCQLDPTATVGKIQTALPGCGRPRFGGAPNRHRPRQIARRGLCLLGDKLLWRVASGKFKKARRKEPTGTPL